MWYGNTNNFSENLEKLTCGKCYLVIKGRNYLVMKAKEVRLVKEMKRSINSLNDTFVFADIFSEWDLWVNMLNSPSINWFPTPSSKTNSERFDYKTFGKLEFPTLLSSAGWNWRTASRKVF